MADGDDRPVEGDSHQKLAELLLDLIDRQSADTTDEGARTKFAELRARILTLEGEDDA